MSYRKTAEATSGIEYTDEVLVVHGISTSNQPYAIEITDPRLAMIWRGYLRYTKYVRLSFGKMDSREP